MQRSYLKKIFQDSAIAKNNYVQGQKQPQL